MARKAKNPILVAFGDHVRAARIERGLTQEALAIGIGRDRSYVGRVERAETNPGLTTVVHLARALGLDLSELVADLNG